MPKSVLFPKAISVCFSFAQVLGSQTLVAPAARSPVNAQSAGTKKWCAGSRLQKPEVRMGPPNGHNNKETKAAAGCMHAFSMPQLASRRLHVAEIDKHVPATAGSETHHAVADPACQLSC